MKRFLLLLKPVRGKIIAFTLLLLASTFCELALPLLMSSIVDNGIKLQNMHLILTLSLVMLGVAAVGFALTVLAQYLSTFIISGFTRDLRETVFDHANNMKISDINRIGTGALLTRSTSDIIMLQDFLDMMIRAIVVVPVFIIGGSVLAYMKDALLATIILICAPLIICGTFLISKKLEPLIEKSNHYIDRQNTIVRERLSGIRVIRAFNMEDKEHGRMAHATNVMADNIIKANVFMGILTPIALLILNAVVVLILYFGASRMSTGAAVKVGDIVAIIQYISLIMSAVFSSAMAIVMLPRARVATSRINEILSCEKVGRGKSSITPDGSLYAENLSFAYCDSGENALEGINIHASCGQTVALIGGTGSGKSTFLMCLAAIHGIKSGMLYIGGRDITTLTPDDVCAELSVVFQKSDIFSGTIRENLDPSNAGYTDEHIFEVLKIAQFDTFVREHGLDYELNQAGSNLSGGQKQRLAITRALLKPSQIYVFDDSFSALDYLTEQKLRAGLTEYLSGKTLLLATQRVATAKNCDCIYVFDAGRVIGTGTHDELMQTCELYREIYNSQTGGNINA